MLEFFNQYSDVFENILPIMADNNSNYLCVYFQGENKGKACYLSHDEIDLSPQFNNIGSLIKAINNNPDSWDFTDIPKECLDY